MQHLTHLFLPVTNQESDALSSTWSTGREAQLPLEHNWTEETPTTRQLIVPAMIIHFRIPTISHHSTNDKSHVDEKLHHLRWTLYLSSWMSSGRDHPWVDHSGTDHTCLNWISIAAITSSPNLRREYTNTSTFVFQHERHKLSEEAGTSRQDSRVVLSRRSGGGD